MDRPDVDTLFAVIQRAYPARFDPDDLTADLWAEMLADLQARDVMAAVKLLIAEEDWPPTIAQIRRKIDERIHPLPDPEGAVARLDLSFSRYGEDEDPELDGFHKRIVEELGGRRRLYREMSNMHSRWESDARNAAKRLRQAIREDRTKMALIGGDTLAALPSETD